MEILPFIRVASLVGLQQVGLHVKTDVFLAKKISDHTNPVGPTLNEYYFIKNNAMILLLPRHFCQLNTEQYITLQKFVLTLPLSHSLSPPSLSLPHPYFSASFVSPFPSSFLSLLKSRFSIAAKGSGGMLKLPQEVQAKPCGRSYFGAFPSLPPFLSFPFVSFPSLVSSPSSLEI